MKTTSCLLALSLALLATPPALGQERTLPAPTTTPGVRTTALAARVEIVDGVATTTLRQRIRNDSAVAQGEATWLLPLPAGAVADDLRLRDANGVEMESDVLGADEARGVYESIVRRKRDPALLEYVGRGCLRARVFPVPAGREVEVEVTFRHVLPRVGALTRWSFPVGAAGVDGAPPELVTLDLVLRSKRPIGNAFSPSAGVDVVRKDDRTVRASFEGKGASVAEGELAVVYGLSEADFGLDLMTSRRAGDEEGSFLLLVSPKRELDAARAQPRDIAFVLDTSGSMAGEKIEQARGSLRFFLKSLDARDRFNVVPFSTEARPFFEEPKPAYAENVAIALGLVESIEAVGGTNIGDALERALRRSPGSAGSQERVPIVVFLTDGRPTVGKTEASDLLALARDDGAVGTRIFVLGVGSDVNTVLLDTLAKESRGTRDYVRPSEDIELVAGALFTKLSRPVLTDLALEVDGVRLSRLVPKVLPDLFAGERLEVLGRYAGGGEHAIRLTGTYLGERRTFVYEGRFAGAEETRAEAFDFVPALWAERRVAWLLDEMRLTGRSDELVDEVARLGREFGIVTPFTSHLVVEEGLRLAQGDAGAAAGPLGPFVLGRGSAGPQSPSTGAADTGSDGFLLGRGERRSGSAPSASQLAKALRENGVLADDADEEAAAALAGELLAELERGRDELASLADGPVSGEDAVERSRLLKDLVAGRRSAEPEAWSRLFVRRAKDKVFHLRRGVWTDATLDPAAGKERTVVEAFSDAYFALLRERPALVPYLAVGERVLVRLGDLVVEVVPAEEGD